MKLLIQLYEQIKNVFVCPPYFNHNLKTALRQYSTKEIEEKLKESPNVKYIESTRQNIFRWGIKVVLKNGHMYLGNALNKRRNLIQALDMLVKTGNCSLNIPLFRSSFIPTS